jgi:hypothetical protein
MHHITLEVKENKLSLQLNEEEYKILVIGVNKYPNDDNFAIWEWMKSDICTKHHFYKICNTFYNLQPVKLTILD